MTKHSHRIETTCAPSLEQLSPRLAELEQSRGHWMRVLVSDSICEVEQKQTRSDVKRPGPAAEAPAQEVLSEVDARDRRDTTVDDCREDKWYDCAFILYLQARA